MEPPEFQTTLWVDRIREYLLRPTAGWAATALLPPAAAADTAAMVTSGTKSDVTTYAIR